MSNPRKRKTAAVAEPAASPNPIPVKKVKSSKPHLNNLPGNDFVSAISTYRKSPDVVVVVEGEAFTLPKQLLCDLSPFFDRAFNGDFKEGNEQKVELEATNVTSFQHVIRWMYMGSTAIPAPPETPLTETINQYVGFFQLADLLDLQGSSVSDYLALKTALQGDRTQLSADHIRSAYNLPTLFAQACIKNYFGGMRSPVDFRFQREVDDMDGFAVDLLKAFQNAAKGKLAVNGYGGTSFVDPLDGSSVML